MVTSVYMVVGGASHFGDTFVHQFHGLVLGLPLLPSCHVMK